MGAESRMIGVLDSLQSNVLNAFPYRCAVMRNRNASCSLCAQACTSGAISITEDEVSVDPDLCVGCGTCATVCPTCALEANNPADLALRAACATSLATTEGAPAIVCDRAWEQAADIIDPDKVARVRCLGRVDESVVVELVAKGARQVRLVHGDCGSCPRNAGVETYNLVADTADTLLETWDSPVRVELLDKVPADLGFSKDAKPVAANLPYDETRRHLLSQLGGAALSSLAEGAAEAVGMADAGQGAGKQIVREGTKGRADAVLFMKTMHDGTLPHFLPDRREHLLDALAELGEPHHAALETRLCGRVSIDTDLCKTCFMCASFCPTGAIAKFEDANGDVGIDHTPADCVKCRCCTDVCPTGALTLAEDVMADAFASSSVVEHVVMPPITDGRGGPHSMLGAMKKLMKIDQFYER